MAPKIRVAVCGSSLYMTALAASLQANPDVEVLRIPASTAALSQAIAELGLSVMTFDLGEMPGDLAISLLRDRPDLILVGVDPSSERMLLLSGRQEQPLSASELLQAISRSGVSGPLSTFRSTAEQAQKLTGSQGGSDEGG